MYLVYIGVSRVFVFRFFFQNYVAVNTGDPYPRVCTGLGFCPYGGDSNSAWSLGTTAAAAAAARGQRFPPRCAALENTSVVATVGWS